MSSRVKHILLVDSKEQGLLHNVKCMQDLEASFDYLQDDKIKKREVKPQKGFAGMVDYEPAEYVYMSYKHFLKEFLKQKQTGILVANVDKYSYMLSKYKPKMYILGGDFDKYLDKLPKSAIHHIMVI